MQAKERVARNHEDRAVRHVKNAQGPENERKADGDKRVISGKSDPGGQHLQQDRQNFFLQAVSMAAPAAQRTS